MGSASSKQLQLPLDELSKEEVAEVVASYGEKFRSYAPLIEENGIDGELLSSLTEDEFLETLDEVGITARLHRRKLLNEFRRSTNSSDSCTKSTALSTLSRTTSLMSDESSRSVIDEFSARLAEQAREMESLRSNVVRLNKERRRSFVKSPPKGRAAIVLTDVQGSTELWEANPQAMRKAIELHDSAIRTVCAAFHGYEIDTEGDAFFLAFHEASDALGFALRLQEDLNTQVPWSQDILSLPLACADCKHGRRGLRVRVAIHMGPVETRQNPVTGRTEYQGHAMDVARSLEANARGGQIVATYDAWNAAFHLADSQLGSPLVAHLGSHTVDQKHAKKGVRPKRILELAPASLSILATNSRMSQTAMKKQNEFRFTELLNGIAKACALAENEPIDVSHMNNLTWSMIPRP